MAAGVTLRAPAKLNLALHVGPLRPDGYHSVGTLMVAIDAPADTVEVSPAATRRVECPGVAERENLAWTALDALAAATGRPMDLAVRIEKRIPAQAGLGGGSSDAAAVLRAARALLRLPLSDTDLEGIAAGVGSDVPFFVRGGAQWAAGRGEVLRPVALPDLAAVVTVPAAPLSTGDVYRALDRMRPLAPEPDPLPPPGSWQAASWVRNDLWRPALALAPSLGRVARALSASGAVRVLLCGSGGAMAGLFRTRPEAERAAALLGDGVLAVAVPVAAGTHVSAITL